ncbi:M23 family metallopeptidase [Solibacillus daqui]|uniref:M23 family metallopeptidase n=1 Tax=Solibacillus daqui TaxID=2912187 RepID=UPI002365AA43|nr:M23 family metallopeptidase [Solibacillus daqui]
MGEDKRKPSRKPFMERPWFWPVIYSSIAVMIVGVILSYNVLYNSKQDEVAIKGQPETNQQSILPTASKLEMLKYPFKEELFNEVSIVQEFYDVTADEATREKGLLVFNQVYTTSTGVSIAINSEPFEVVAAMSGEVTQVKMDVFTGNQITLKHPNGMETRYSSVSDIVVKEGDKVTQGEAIAKSQENEWNPQAGVHLYFELLEDGVLINPRKYLSF